LNGGKGDGQAGVDILEGVERPALDLIEEGIQAYPARGDIGGGQGEDILAGSALPAMVHGFNLDKTEESSLFGGVEGANGDEMFEEFPRFGEAFALQDEGGPVFFEGPVDGLPRESGFLGLWTRVSP
jgi:hypothetical protein